MRLTRWVNKCFYLTKFYLKNWSIILSYDETWMWKQYNQTYTQELQNEIVTKIHSHIIN